MKFSTSTSNFCVAAKGPRPETKNGSAPSHHKDTSVWADAASEYRTVARSNIAEDQTSNATSVHRPGRPELSRQGAPKNSGAKRRSRGRHHVVGVDKMRVEQLRGSNLLLLRFRKCSSFLCICTAFQGMMRSADRFSHRLGRDSFRNHAKGDKVRHLVPHPSKYSANG